MEKEMLEIYGPVMGGRDLVKALGYRSLTTFRKAVRDGALGVKVFSLPDRQGKYALTRDVARFIELHAGTKSGEKEKST